MPGDRFATRVIISGKRDYAAFLDQLLQFQTDVLVDINDIRRQLAVLKMHPKCALFFLSNQELKQ